MEPLLPDRTPRRGGQWTDHREVVEAILWRLRTGSPWRDLAAGFPPWQTVWWRCDRWAKDGTFDRVLAQLQGFAHAADELEWVVPVDSTIAQAHQHAAWGRRRVRGAWSNHRNRRPEPADHALGHSRGGWTTKAHAGSGRDNPQLIGVLDDIAVPTGGRARSRAAVLIADKAYSHPSTRKALRRRQIRTVIPERSDQKARRTARKRQRRTPTGPRRRDLQATQRRRTECRGGGTSVRRR